jgi:branched-chain amino acid transport system substrate-binding protein
MGTYRMNKFVLLCLLAVLAVAPFGSPARAQPAPLQIDVMLSLTGGAAFLGQAEWKAIQAAQAVVNAEGGVNGRPVSFVADDDGSSPQTALQLANTIGAKGFPLFLGSELASACQSYSALIAASGPVDYCLSPPVHAASGGYMFTAGASAFDLARALMHYLRDRGLTRVAVIVTTDATGRDFEASYNAAFALPENKSFQVAVTEHYNTTDLSVAAQSARIKNANVQAVVSGTIGGATITMLRGANEAGLNVPIAAVNGNMLYQEMAQLKDIMPNELIFPAYRAMTSGDVRPGPIRDAQAKFFSALKSAGLRPDAANVTAWDPVMISMDALRHAGPNASAQQIHAYIESLHSFAGVNGIYDFRDGSQRGISSSAVVIDRWDVGKQTFVVVSKPGGGAKT